jgi:hypothetical protein
MILKLHTDKSVISITVDKEPDEDFISYQNRLFAVAETSNNRRVWEEHKGDVPASAKVFDYVPPAAKDTAGGEPAPDSVPRQPGDAAPQPKKRASVEPAAESKPAAAARPQPKRAKPAK